MGQDETRNEPSRTPSDPAANLPFSAFVLLEAALAPLALVLGWALRQPPLADFAWSEEGALAGLAATLPMLALLAIGVRWPVGPIRRIRDFFDRELAPVLKGCEWPRPRADLGGRGRG